MALEVTTKVVDATTKVVDAIVVVFRSFEYSTLILFKGFGTTVLIKKE